MSAINSLDLTDALINAIKRGETIRTAIKAIIARNHGPLKNILQYWFERYESGKSVSGVYEKIYYVENINLLMLLEYGMEGHPILNNLENLRSEMVRIQQHRIEQHLQVLPYKMMLPLFIFFFPALMWSFLAPFLREMLNAF